MFEQKKRTAIWNYSKLLKNMEGKNLIAFLLQQYTGSGIVEPSSNNLQNLESCSVTHRNLNNFENFSNMLWRLSVMQEHDYSDWKVSSISSTET